MENWGARKAQTGSFLVRAVVLHNGTSRAPVGESVLLQNKVSLCTCSLQVLGRTTVQDTRPVSALSIWNISVPVLYFSSKFSSQNYASIWNPKLCFKTFKSLNLLLCLPEKQKCSRQSKSVVLKLSWASVSAGGLVKTKIAGSYPQSCWFSGSWVGPSSLHF